MELLKKELKILKRSIETEFKLTEEELYSLYSVYPFNRFEYIISHLISQNIIDLPKYLEIREDYLIRNKFLYIFEISAPRVFGTWGERHLLEKEPQLNKPSKKFDPEYNGEYDLWMDGIKIEVKASRAVNANKPTLGMVEKALNFSSEIEFNMNFQQLKPKMTDVFVWIGIWTDEIKYWVMSSSEVKNNKYFSNGQHRGNTGEGQLWITQSNINDFDMYLTKSDQLLKKIKEKSKCYIQS